jgi:hypothetical protein
VRNKIGRNDPCWCGSGLKYKKCHMNREEQEPLQLWQADKEFKKAFNIKDCLAPKPMKAQCSGTIAKAHTVPKSSSLQQIARNGHVYSFVPGIQNIEKGKGKLPPQLLGINKASTFTGFCSFHDNAIFSKIERQSFMASQERCFLLAYRSLTRELYNAKALVPLLDLMRQTDRGKPLVQQFAIQHMTNLISEGSSKRLQDTEHYKAIYDNILLSGDFNGVRAYIIELDSPPPIMCSTSILPEESFNGEKLQDVDDIKVTPHLLSFSSFYGGKHGIIAFTWLPESDPTCLLFINSLKALPPDRITDSLIRFFFEFSENLHIQPDWWENLAVDKRESLINRLADSANPMLARKSGCLTEDGIKYDNWSISNLKSIGF